MRARGALLLLCLPLLAACTSDTTPATDAALPTESARPAVGWQRLPAPTDLPEERPLRAGFLIVDGVYNSELMAPYDIFHHTVFHVRPGMEVFTVSPDGRPVTSFEGLEIGAHHGFDDAPEIDVLVVPSAEHGMDRDLEDEALIGWVRRVGRVGRRARFVVSLCNGALVDHLYGERVAGGVARGMAWDWPEVAAGLRPLVLAPAAPADTDTP